MKVKNTVLCLIFFLTILACNESFKDETQSDGGDSSDIESDDDSDNVDFNDESVPGDYHYKVDQFGYLPQAPKLAIISQAQKGQFSPDDFEPGSEIEVRTWPENEAVYSGTIEAWNNGREDAIHGDIGWVFDFSEVTEPGSYRLYDVEKELYSHLFRISDDVYRIVLIQAVRTYFYQREAFVKEEPYADVRWADAASFLNDKNARNVFDRSNADSERDVSGGWMDAGDYNKYITFLDGVVHLLLMSYQQRPDVWVEDHNIPESGNDIPDLLDEINFEIEWMKKMQDEDGGVFIKAGDADYNSASPPSTHNFPRYYGMKCSSSSISLAAIFAHTAFIFRDIDGLKDQAEEIIPMAEAAWEWFQNNPKSDACDNGEIKSGDADRTLVEQEQQAARAAMWLWAVTGKDAYHDYFKDNYQTFEKISTSWWGPYNLQDEDALLFYTSLPKADPAVASAIVSSKKSGAADASFYGWNLNSDLYMSSMPDWSFHWGHVTPRAVKGSMNMNMVEYQLNTQNDEAYQRRALETLHWFHGRNALGKVMLSNMYEFGAEDSVNEFYHSWFSDGSKWDSVLTDIGPAPGYLVGGPNKDYTGTTAPPANEPPSKSYIDYNAGWPDSSWEITENAIYYQAAYLRLLAYFVSSGR